MKPSGGASNGQGPGKGAGKGAGNRTGNHAEESLARRAARLMTHVTRDIWVEDYSQQTLQQRRVVTATRWLFLVVYGFLRDRCLLRAAALSFTTTLSIAPFLAVAFTISKALGLQNTEYVRSLLLQFSAGRSDLVDLFLRYVQNTNVKTLGYVGLVVLLFTALSLLGSIEKAFNDIWGVAKGRSPWRKFTDFFSVTLICPLLLFVGLSVTVSLHNEAVVQKILTISAFNYIYLSVLKVLPYVMMWLALTFLYSFMPNTQVNLLCALAGGVVAGTLWQLAQWGYVNWQIGVAKYNAIYGGFAQFPLFLFWLYISWAIVLLGAEICFSLQNMKTFESEVRAGHITFEGRVKTAILFLLLLVDAFKKGVRPLNNEHAAQKLGVPVKAVNEVAETLAGQHVVTRLDDEFGPTYALSRDPADVRVTDVLRGLGRGKGQSGLDFIDPRFAFVHDVFHQVFASAEEAPPNLSIETLWHDHCPHLEASCDWAGGSGKEAPEAAQSQTTKPSKEE
ncbi:ribonuclease BN [Desulfovibrio sp. X2]|uniref:YihY/virulence factor BrkB family protein n=1 Tax=Desulfovibrio sp. X2 TaxID=941449 RepID=UPI000358E88D|nr:YihY/virulence factor BrkB family protein [Desulfovibrio sp. X2]EPR43590.1 ribonuclease BN [Desulfovibrio sp. X2]